MDKLFTNGNMSKTLEDISLDYERTEITTAFLHDRSNNTFINIFSVAEMCPYEQEKSSDIYEINGEGKKVNLRRLNLNATQTVYINRYFSPSPRDAISFYRGSGNKRGVKMQSGDILIDSANERLTEEPLNEVPIIIPWSTNELFSIREVLPKRNVSLRACSLLDLEGECLDLFAEDELIKIGKFIGESIGVDLLKYSEYLGAVILCFANPLLRYMKESLSRSKRQIVIQLFERKNQTVIGGKVELSDERASGKGFIITREIEKTSFGVNIPCPPEKLRFRLFNNDGDLIEDRSGHFMNEIRVNIGIKSHQRRFIKENKNGKSEESVIDVVDYQNDKHGEKDTPQTVISKSNKNRELDSLEEKREFIYFPGNNKESKIKAQMVVRELLGGAKERCIICDPYLSGNDVLNYALFVKHSNVEVKLLSSANYLNRRVEGGGIRHGEQLKDIIEDILSKDKTLNINCHVLLGTKKSPLHDRFIVIDHDVYLLGSSLNEFGSRATTLFKSPDPRPLIRQAEIWFGDRVYSKNIDEWLEDFGHRGKVDDEC